MAKQVKKSQVKITIELVTDKPVTGSGLADVAYDAYTFKKEIAEVVWTGRDGHGDFRMGDKYRVASVKVEQGDLE